MERSSEFESLLVDAFREFQPVVTMRPDAYRLAVTRGSKRVEVLWPEVAEVFFAFKVDGVTLFSDSLEYYDGEPRTEQVSDAASAVGHFLQGETRVVEVGTILKRRELQYSKDGKWRPIWDET